MRNSPTLLTCIIYLCAAATRTQADSSLRVDLDARDASAGAAIWVNRGSLGPFARVAKPIVTTVANVRAVSFDGLQDAYLGPPSSPDIEGAAPRSIEVWAYDALIDSDEETLVSWGRRGGPEGTLIAFGWGRNPSYGAMAHWANDLGWNGVPTPGRWHYLVYTYDGRIARVYDNAVEKNSRELTINTAEGLPIVIAAQHTADGQIQFKNEYTGSQQAGSLAIAELRIRTGALTAAQVGANFAAEAKRFNASRADAEGILGAGRDRYEAGGFALTLLRATGTAASLSPFGRTDNSHLGQLTSPFDFLPGDRLMGRSGDGFYHLGDFTLQLRTGGSVWTAYSSAGPRGRVVRAVRRGGDRVPEALAAESVMLGPNGDCPIQVVREWRVENHHLVLRFQLFNRSARPVEIGAFGAAMVFNNLITGRSLNETHDRCSFADPYIGGPAGYLQVTRLNGQGPALLVLPEDGTSFEAYRPLYDDPTPRDVTFEGFYEWMVHTKAYAEREWQGAAPWNRPTSRTLQPGQIATYGFRFVLAPAIKEIEATLIAQNRPVAVGVPGYVLPTDVTSRLFIHLPDPVRTGVEPHAVQGARPLVRQPNPAVMVEPVGAMRAQIDPTRTRHGWLQITVTGLRPGRCRLVLSYGAGLRQFIHYFVIPPEAEQVRRLGSFHASKQWFTDPSDPFHRTCSFLPYDRDLGKMVVQHPHTWFSGLSDEIGAGASVAMAMKNLGQPDPHEVALLEKYVNTTLWGHVQNPDYSVRASLFYYQPDLLPNYRYTVREGWDRARTETTWRSFNYPHVACVYWALYHLARDHEGLTTEQPWSWYLDQAYQTTMAIRKFAPGYAEVGLMVGSVFPEIVRDLRREGWTAKADDLEGYMHERERRWEGLRYPFGSEMPWDSTGQEEIYTWCRYFGADDKAQVTLDAILGYMPTVPNWAYNGAGRRYFDAPVNGTRWPQIVRMTNHYGSAINSIPVLDAYRRSPDDLYLLRVGYAGMDQILANIDADGFGSYGFDADPAILQFDPYTADYGIAFYGYARNAGAYALQHPEFGWLGFGCDVHERAGEVEILPRDAFRRSVFLAPLHLRLTLEAGTFESVIYEPRSGNVRVTLAPATPWTRTARLRVERTGPDARPVPAFALDPSCPIVRDAYEIPLRDRSLSLTLRNKAK